MPAILSILSKNGTALIDQNWRTLSLTSVRDFAEADYIYIPRQSLYSILAISCQTEGVMLIGAYYLSGFSGKTTDYYTIKGNLKIFEFADVEIQFDPNGLNVRNGTTGVLVFSSKLKPLRVIRHFTGIIANISANQIIFEGYLDPSRRYAVVLGNMPFRIEVGKDVAYVHSLAVTTRDSDGYVKVQYIKKAYNARTGGVRGKISVQGNYSFQIIDVTYY